VLRELTAGAVFFGRVDVKMKAAPGQGIVSSIVLESADLDEIDWEFIGGDNAQVQTNFYGKGNTTTYDRVIYHPVTTPQTLFHTYSIDWNAERLQFLIDGSLVRTVEYSEPKTVYGKNYPQTPMKLKLGNWCGGCEGSNQGTVEWAGGKTTFGDKPYTMVVDSVTVQNYNPADSYEWSDRSGSWESIDIINDGSSSKPTGGANGGISTSAKTTSAPTSSHSVEEITKTNTPSVTLSGSSYSMNTASVSAQNPSGPTGSYGSGSSGSGSGSNDSPADSTFASMTVIGGITQAPSSGATGGGMGAGANGTITGGSPPAQQTGNSAATLTVASGSIFGLVLSLLFL